MWVFTVQFFNVFYRSSIFLNKILGEPCRYFSYSARVEHLEQRVIFL